MHKYQWICFNYFAVNIHAPPTQREQSKPRGWNVYIESDISSPERFFFCAVLQGLHHWCRRVKWTVLFRLRSGFVSFYHFSNVIYCGAPIRFVTFPKPISCKYTYVQLKLVWFLWIFRKKNFWLNFFFVMEKLKQNWQTKKENGIFRIISENPLVG